MNKSVVIGIVAVIVVAGGGYLVFHKSPAKTPAASTTNTAVSTAPAVHNAVLSTRTNSTLGQYLADPSGKALYTYNGDKAGVSNCTGSCLANWPAYIDQGSTTKLPSGVGTIKRSDNGQTQYTYQDMPLYYFVSDGSGQVTGNGIDNFSVAKPSTGTSSSSSSTTPSSSGSSSGGSSTYNY